MAPLVNIDMDQMHELDLQQSYWLLFSKMKDDFVCKEDLEQALKAATVNGGIQGNEGGPVVVSGATIAYALLDTIARQKSVAYSKLAKSGGVVRQLTVEGLEALTS